MHAATSKVENSAQGSSCQLKFVHTLAYHAISPNDDVRKKFDNQQTWRIFPSSSPSTRHWVQSCPCQKTSWKWRKRSSQFSKTIFNLIERFNKMIKNSAWFKLISNASFSLDFYCKHACKTLCSNSFVSTPHTNCLYYKRFDDRVWRSSWVIPAL